MGETIICAICKQPGKAEHTIREAWMQAGGWGSVPDSAIVHPACDKKEQSLLKSGRLKLSALYQTARATSHEGSM